MTLSGCGTGMLAHRRCVCMARMDACNEAYVPETPWDRKN